MAHPWLSELNFETGASTWDSETDTNAKLNVSHYTVLARHKLTPFRGAYAAHIDLKGGTADAFLQEDDDYDLAADGTIFWRMYFYARDLVMAANDRFTIFALESGSGTNEVAISILYTAAGGFQLVAAETGAVAIGAATRATSLVQGQWHCLELGANIDAGGGNDGTIDFFVDGYQVGAQITALDQAAIVHARLGVTGVDAGTTAGHLVFDQVVADNLRVYPLQERWPMQQILTRTAHVFVGPGCVESAALLTAGADNTLHLYDTDAAGSTAELDRVVDLSIGANSSFGGPIRFERGCYAVLAGTSPRGQVVIREASAYHSDASILNRALGRS